ncbi:MAG: ParB N-terminal domain-containing protein [Selenomonadaceae bacterium]|nr:ParB N-terminal domain-containing protein [Selenomonadaceae bacterium]
MEAQMIEMYKIDPDAIYSIRPVDEESEPFKVLSEVIRQDKQKYPIIIRRLTDEDRKNRPVKDGAEFGIIDGQHRFRIAQKNGQTEILASINDEEIPPMSTRKMEDVKIALRMNTGIPLTVVQKGKIIYEMSKGKDIAEIGEELFGIATAMAYRCVQAYKVEKNIKTSTKVRNKVVTEKKLTDLGEIWSQIPRYESEIDFNDVNKSVEQLDMIEKLEHQLGSVKRIFLSKNDIKDEFTRLKKDRRAKRRAEKNSAN